jgi:hypothetical protein
MDPFTRVGGPTVQVQRAPGPLRPGPRDDEDSVKEGARGLNRDGAAPGHVVSSMHAAHHRLVHARASRPRAAVLLLPLALLLSPAIAA